MITVYPDLPYEHAGGDGGVRSTTQMVVIHATDNTASDEAEASYAETRPDHTSAHFYADDDSVIQALPTDHVAYGCFSVGNGRSVQFELTGRDWPDSQEVHDAAMRRVAPIVARVCRDWGIPVRKLSVADLRAGARGICGHADVTAAWGQGDHTDPGPAFPWSTFLSYVAGGGEDEMIDYSQQVPDGPARAGNPGRTIGQWVGDVWAETFGVPGKVDALAAKVDALAARPAATVVMTQADRDAIAADVAAQLGGKLDQILTRLTAAGKAAAGEA